MQAAYIERLVSDATVGTPGEREVGRIRTLGEGLELESKIDLSNVDQVVAVISALQGKGIAKRAIRHEMHHVYADTPEEYHGIILIDGSTEVWVRSKKSGAVIETPNLGIPAFLREERKVNPRSPGNYAEFMDSVLSSQQVGRFDKTCIDLSFWDGNLSYTVTFSLADKRGQQCYQAEIEFDGHRVDTPQPSAREILTGFEAAAQSVLGDNFSKRTKLEWLLAKNEALSYLTPRYKMVSREDAVETLCKQSTAVTLHA